MRIPAATAIVPLAILISAAALASEPADSYSFIPLKPGAVCPAGWLLDWSRAAADGITGHLDERSPVFAKCYDGTHFEAQGVQPGGCGWPLEQGAYWLDGLVRLAYILDDPVLIDKAKTRLDLVVDGVLGGGESFIYWQPESVLQDTFNNWAHSHIGRALVAYYQASEDPRVLKALVKVYRDYPLPPMATEVFDPVSGACNVDSMLDTYRLSGDRKILENALAYANSPAFKVQMRAWAAGSAPDGHGVILLENARVPAVLYKWTGRQELLDASLRVLSDKYRDNGLPSGVISAEEYLAGVGSTRNTETCNVAAGLWTHYWLLRVTGDSAQADRMERIFFNAGPVPVSRDFQLVAYYQTPNRTGERLPGEQPSLNGYGYSELADGPLCCVGSSNRIIPTYVMHMWMSTSDHGLAATLYGPSRVTASVADDVPVGIESRTDYPFGQQISMRIETPRPVRFPLYLRVPGWCEDAEIRVNGLQVDADADERGFVRIEREWNSGDRVELGFPMQPRVEIGQETPYPDTQIHGHHYFGRGLAKRKEMGEPFASVHFGPLLFALPINDKNPNEPSEEAHWNYALDVAPRSAPSKIETRRRAMPTRWQWQLADAPLQLRVPAVEFAWQPSGLHPLPTAPVVEGKATTISLVPLGCTKFRISMFPVSQTLWQDAPLRRATE
jgi:hypothetical protein